MTVGIRELKNRLSRYVAMVKQGERVQVTEHGRVVAELVPPSVTTEEWPTRRRLITSGVVTPASENGDPLEGWDVLTLQLPAGTVRSLIDTDHDEREQ